MKLSADRVEWLGSATLFHADCFEVLPFLVGVDAVLMDPPYGSTYNKWDKGKLDVARLWESLLGCTSEWATFALFSDFRFAMSLVLAQPHLFRYDLVWRKSRAVGFLDANRRPLRIHEMLCIFCRQGYTPYFPQKMPGKPYSIKRSGYASNYRPNTLRIGVNNTTGDRYPTSVLDFKSATHTKHPTQKPVELMEWLVKTYTKPGDVILDPFMGSGTTGVAAVKNGRRFIGVERDWKYFDIACWRVWEAMI